MMKSILSAFTIPWRILMLFSVTLIFVLTSQQSEARGKRYGERLCKSNSYYDCYRVRRGDSWNRLWPDPHERKIVRYANRMNTRMWPGLVIAVPKNLHRLSIIDIAPFPHYIDPPGEKLVIFRHRELAWAAYNASGKLVNWAPASGGQNYCRDVKRGCRTAKGKFRFYTKQGRGCVSRKYPLGKGGAKMPYCMFFYRGFALHGSYSVPGYHASHGCVRTFKEAARWLNTSFVDLPSKKYNTRGTRIIVE